MNELSNDFVKRDTVTLDVDGKVFKYRPVTAGEENEWLNKYTKIVNGVVVQDLGEGNKCKLQNIVEVPYPSELIREITGIDKTWSVMTIDERWELFSRLKPTIFAQIIKAIDGYDDNSVEKKT